MHKLVSMWNIVAGSTLEAELRAVYIKGTLDSAFEGGFHLPMVCCPVATNCHTYIFQQPGKFEQWVKDNTEKFKELAAALTKISVAW